jgi:hypothetical protein
LDDFTRYFFTPLLANQQLLTHSNENSLPDFKHLNQFRVLVELFPVAAEAAAAAGID